MREAAREYKWTLNYSGIALMWRGGCIIRSVFLGDITNAYKKNQELENLLFDDFFNKAGEIWIFEVFAFLDVSLTSSISFVS